MEGDLVKWNSTSFVPFVKGNSKSIFFGSNKIILPIVINLDLTNVKPEFCNKTKPGMVMIPKEMKYQEILDLCR